MTLNRSETLNAINTEMVGLIHDNIKALKERGDELNILILQEAGKTFSSGGDVQTLLNGAQIPEKAPDLHGLINDAYRSLFKLSTLKAPNVSLMDGITVGLGAGFCYCTNFKIATENTQLLMPETAIGHFYDVGSSYYLSRLRGYYGRYLTLCAERAKAEDLLSTGLIKHYVPSARLDSMIAHVTRLQEQNTTSFANCCKNHSGVTPQNGCHGFR